MHYRSRYRGKQLFCPWTSVASPDTTIVGPETMRCSGLMTYSMHFRLSHNSSSSSSSGHTTLRPGNSIIFWQVQQNHEHKVQQETVGLNLNECDDSFQMLGVGYV